MLRRPLLALLPVAVSLGLPTLASAATVAVQAPVADDEPGTQPLLLVAASPGERNDVRVEVQRGVRVEVTDVGSAAPVAGPGCRRLRARTVACDDRAVGLVRVDLGDRDDRLEAVDRRAGRDPVLLQADGGAGDDILVGTQRADELRGGPGADVLRGEGGGDQLEVADTGTPRPDRVDGGPGRDLVTYEGEPSGVRVTRHGGTRRGAPVASRDRFRHVELLAGSVHADVLDGTDGDDVLMGDGGADLLRGGRGDDVVDGAGVLEGGPGDDELATNSSQRGGPSPARMACGPGRDVVTGGTLMPAPLLIEADCEGREVPGGFAVEPVPRRTADGLAVGVACMACSRGATLDVRVSTASTAAPWRATTPFGLPLAGATNVVPAAGGSRTPQLVPLTTEAGATAVLAAPGRRVVDVVVDGAPPAAGAFRVRLATWQAVLPAAG